MYRKFIYDCNHHEKKPVIENIGLHLVFRLPLTWERVQSITIEKHVVENIRFGFRMVFLSSVRAKIYVLPV